MRFNDFPFSTEFIFLIFGGIKRKGLYIKQIFIVHKKMVTQKNSLKIILPLLVIFSLLAWFVVAELGTNHGIKVVSPLSGSNFTNLSLGQTFLNATFINGTTGTGLLSWSGPTGFNVTFLVNNTFLANGTVNLTGKWMQIANGTGICVRIGNGPDFSCAVNTTNINFTLLEGTYSLTANISNATNGFIANLTNSSQTIKIDRSVPRVGVDNFSGSFASEVNLSSINSAGLFTINVSVDDLVLGVQTVLFNITNRSSGVSNATLTATREGSSSNFVATVNTSHYSDGSYNITVLVNDSLNNLNNTAVLQRVIFDTNAPTLSFSCTPNPVDEGDTITCSCSATDHVSGLNRSYGSSGIVTTVNPSTAQTGPSFSVGCTSQDNSGNLRSATATYAVSSTGSGGSTGGSSGGSTGGSTGSAGSSGSATGNSTGSTGAGTGLGGSGQAQGATAAEESSGGFSMGWIIAIIVIAAIVVGIIVMVKRKN